MVSELQITEEPNWIILGSLSSMALFFTFFFGQINVLLYISLGEFLLFVQKRRDFRAGLFLAIWLIKPQTLIFILPWLLVTRRFRILTGFGVGSLIILISSTLIAGGNWFMIWINLLLLYPKGLATTNPLAMMNWRSLALNLEPVIPPFFAWGIAIAGMMLTTFWMIKTWKNRSNESQFALALLCTYAATCAVTWHAHIHMALPLLAPILVLLANKNFTYKMWYAFVGFPFLGLIISIATKIWFPVNSILPMTILVINVYLTQWGAKEMEAHINMSFE